MDIFSMSRATTGLTEDEVVIDDPEAPFVLHVGTGRLTIESKDGQPIRRSWLTSLPLREIMQAAVALSHGDDNVNESYFRRLAAGGRASLDDRVLAVASWADQVSRPGGPAQAIADFWGVSVRTGRRWLQTVRERSPASS